MKLSKLTESIEKRYCGSSERVKKLSESSGKSLWDIIEKALEKQGLNEAKEEPMDDIWYTFGDESAEDYEKDTTNKKNGPDAWYTFGDESAEDYEKDTTNKKGWDWDTVEKAMNKYLIRRN